MTRMQIDPSMERKLGWTYSEIISNGNREWSISATRDFDKKHVIGYSDVSLACAWRELQDSINDADRLLSPKERIRMNTNEQVTFPSGAVRSTDSDDVRYDLIPPIALRRLAMRYAMGAAKYGDNNWQKGFPIGNILNHLQDHLEKWKLEGCKDDDNLAGAMWGIATLMWYEKHKPELLTEAGVPV